MSIEIKKATKEQIPQIVELYNECFLHREPMTSSFGLTIEESKDYFSFLFTHAIELGYMLVAVDTENDAVAGFDMAAFDLPEDAVLPPINDKIRKAVSDTGVLFGKVEPLLVEKTGAALDEFFHPIYMGVHTSYCNQGLALRMTEGIIEVGRQAGYKYIRWDCTNPKSVGCMKKLGFSEFARLKYSESGVKSLEHLDGELSVFVLAL